MISILDLAQLHNNVLLELVHLLLREFHPLLVQAWERDFVKSGVDQDILFLVPNGEHWVPFVVLKNQR